MAEHNVIVICIFISIAGASGRLIYVGYIEDS